MYGGTLRPNSSAFLANKPAPNITDGLLVLVQLVIADITTEPKGNYTRLLSIISRYKIYIEIIDKWSSSSILRKTISEPQTGIEPATFWWPVRRSNHWATKAQMVSWDASSTYVRPKRKPLHANNDIDEIYILEMRELGDILRWQMNVHQALSSEKRFLNPCLGLRKKVAGSISV